MTRYFLDKNNDNLALTLGFETEMGMILTGLPSDISADAIKFDIGVEGEEAIISEDLTVIVPTSPQQVKAVIPANTFTKPLKKQLFQIRYTQLGGNEKVILKRFLDVRNPVTPKP